MADARVLRDLAEEVERLDGFSRDTNNRIARALGWQHLSKTASGRLHGGWLDPAEQHGINEGRTLHRDPPPWTGSIDAAAKLMPSAWRRRVDIHIRMDGGTTIFAKGGRGREEEGRAKTEALAPAPHALSAP